ncbi:MAG: PH domain-containing protein, partial [Anaerolineaceae bacterium]
ANLLAAVVLIAVGIWLLLRMHTLFTTRYMLSRGGLELRWGLRREVIPMPAVQWIRPVSDFQTRLPLPPGALPGMIFGSRTVPGLGAVEYAAADPRALLLVASSGRYYAISPSEPEPFLSLYERLSELGSLVNYEPRSESLGSLRKKIWQDKAARLLLAGGLAAGLALLALALALAGSRAEITWTTLEQVPSNQVFLLAFFSLFIWLVNCGIGLFFSLRGGMEKAVIYLLWAWSILISLLLAAAMLILAL